MSTTITLDAETADAITEYRDRKAYIDYRSGTTDAESRLRIDDAIRRAADLIDPPPTQFEKVLEEVLVQKGFINEQGKTVTQTLVDQGIGEQVRSIVSTLRALHSTRHLVLDGADSWSFPVRSR